MYKTVSGCCHLFTQHLPAHCWTFFFYCVKNLPRKCVEPFFTGSSKSKSKSGVVLVYQCCGYAYGKLRLRLRQLRQLRQLRWSPSTNPSTYNVTHQGYRIVTQIIVDFFVFAVKHFLTACYNYLYLQVNSLLLFTSHNTIAYIKWSRLMKPFENRTI